MKAPDQTSIGRYKLKSGASEIMHSHAPPGALEPESMLVVMRPPRTA